MRSGERLTVPRGAGTMAADMPRPPGRTDRRRRVSKLEQTISDLTYNDAGLIPAVVIDAETKAVLMVAWMNAQSLKTTVETGKTHFWSRSRKKYWMKGESSGHTQNVQDIYTDCDADTLVVEVLQKGAACHNGYRSCFYRKWNGNEWEKADDRVTDPEEMYKNKQ